MEIALFTYSSTSSQYKPVCKLTCKASPELRGRLTPAIQLMPRPLKEIFPSKRLCDDLRLTPVEDPSGKHRRNFERMAQHYVHLGLGATYNGWNFRVSASGLELVCAVPRVL